MPREKPHFSSLELSSSYLCSLAYPVLGHSVHEGTGLFSDCCVPRTQLLGATQQIFVKSANEESKF